MFSHNVGKTKTCLGGGANREKVGKRKEIGGLEEKSPWKISVLYPLANGRPLFIATKRSKLS